MYRGHLLTVEQLYASFYPVIHIAVDGNFERDESSAASQGNAAFQSEVLFGGKRETLLAYESRYDLDETIAKELEASRAIRGNAADTYGPDGIGLRLFYSARIAVLAFGGEHEYAKVSVDFYNTMKVVGFGMVDADGNYAPTSFYSLTTDSGLEIPLISPQAAPEPGTFTLVAIGAIGLIANVVRRRRQSKDAA